MSESAGGAVSHTAAFLLLVLKASLLSTGGMGNLPALHDDLVSVRGWASERHFAEALAVGQIAPGPNGLWVVSLGYLVGGLRGALAATLAITLPPLFVLVLERGYRRVQDHPAAVGFVRGLGLAVVGAFAVVLFGLLVSGGNGDGNGAPVLSAQSLVTSIVIALTAALIAHTGRVPVVVILLMAAAAGVLLYR
jgi:chromate transporter